MINLIPKSEKNKIAKNFYYKIVILCVLTLGTISFAALVAVLPSYFLSTVRKSIISNKLEAQSKEPVPVPDQQTLQVIKDLKYKINIVEGGQKNKFTVSENIINEIILKKVANIKITDIFYQADPKGTKVLISGNAPSRESLLLFRKALEEDPAFKQVDLPVSNFVKGANIQFSLSLIPK